MPFDPITEFPEACKFVDDFLSGHRIDPYSPEEIAEIMKPIIKEKHEALPQAVKAD
jgi:hypothetical protein